MKLLTMAELAEELGLEPAAGKTRIWRMVKARELKPTAITKKGRALFDADNLEEIRLQVFANGDGQNGNK